MTITSARIVPRTWRCGCLMRQVRFNSSAGGGTPQAPPLLRKIRDDLKTALKAKDTNRLNVLRAVLAEITNQSKTSSPIVKDTQLLSLLKKRATSLRLAADGFGAANRPDLKQKEEAQIKVLEEYAGDVAVMGESELRDIVEKVLSGLGDEGVSKPNVGVILRKLTSDEGLLAGKPFEMKTLAGVVAESLKK
ncbi:MAG: hypothetical protein M1825_003640 [Sarcosagium campestre]|nr:MAG: hypothetical protein M1825_003640 [Sarcosagium campestre]